MKPARVAAGFFTLIVASACASSYAEPARPQASPSYDEIDAQVARAPRPWPGPPAPSSWPYGVEIVGADFETLPAYRASGRAYVMGSVGERYRIRITNPTPRRVEAVVSVDGLDVVDGRAASYDEKRGYVIAPYGEVTVDGFRTSLDQVATFRFSSVRDSYAGRKGQDRNVGVIGVAFFPEREAPVRRLPRPVAPDERARGAEGAAPSLGATARPAPPAKGSPSDGEAGGGRSSRDDAPAAEAKRESGGPSRPGSAPAVRPGLGTEFGERRLSSVQYTTFQRANPSRPGTIAEVRYDDRAGLAALGVITADPRVDDLSLRETADPFPRHGFAAPPPPRW